MTALLRRLLAWLWEPGYDGPCFGACDDPFEEE